MTLGAGSYDIRGRYITYYWGWITLMTLGARYITYYWGWITLMTLGADILHIIEVGDHFNDN